eukprot:13191875-Alexandrium_andersonii.AAC.1
MAPPRRNDQSSVGLCGDPRGVMPWDPSRSRPRGPESRSCGGWAGARARRCGRAGTSAARVSAPGLRARGRWACTKRPR